MSNRPKRYKSYLYDDSVSIPHRTAMYHNQQLHGLKTDGQVMEPKTYSIHFNSKEYEGKVISVATKQECDDELQVRIQVAADKAKQPSTNDKRASKKQSCVKEIFHANSDDTEVLKTGIAVLKDRLAQVNETLKIEKEKNVQLKAENERLIEEGRRYKDSFSPADIPKFLRFSSTCFELFGNASHKGLLGSVSLEQREPFVDDFSTVLVKPVVLAELKRLVALHQNDFQSKVVRICFRNILPNEDLTASTGANIWTKHTLVCEAIMGKWQADFKKPI